jgi:uncharacterized membrane protein
MKPRKRSRPKNNELAPIVYRNIRDILEIQKEFDRERTARERATDLITGFIGTLSFVYLEVAFIGGWIVLNTGVIPRLHPFDPYPFVMLTAIASLEAIFLSTFVLISQNRMNRLERKRSNLDLQINLLSEHEVTHLVRMVEAISNQLGVPKAVSEHSTMEELKREVSPRKMLTEIEKAAKNRMAPDSSAGL